MNVSVPRAKRATGDCALVSVAFGFEILETRKKFINEVLYQSISLIASHEEQGLDSEVSIS